MRATSIRSRGYPPSAVLSFLDAHERMLDGDVGCTVILHNADLRGLDLSERKLAGADLAASEFDGASLFGTDLSQAHLAMASLRRVDARLASFAEADMRGVSVRDANFSGARLDKADLGRVCLDPRGSEVSRPSASGPPGIEFEVDFTGCSMQHATLAGARVAGANFSDALLNGSDLRGADLTGARMDGAVLAGVELRGVKASPGAFDRCLLDPLPHAVARVPLLVDRFAAAERWVLSEGREGAPCILDREDLRPLGQTLSGRKLTAASVVRACAVQVSFVGSQLQGARFEGADLRGADFSGADLRGASFRGAKLRHAIFARADLRPLPLANGSARPVDFSNTDAGDDAFANARR